MNIKTLGIILCSAFSVGLVAETALSVWSLVNGQGVTLHTAIELIIAWLVVIFSQRKKIKTVDQGKGGATSAEIINDFRFGEITTFLVFLLSALLLKTIANHIQIAILLACGLLSLFMTLSMTKQLFQSPQNQQTNKEKTQTQKIPQEKERRRKDSKQ